MLALEATNWIRQHVALATAISRTRLLTNGQACIGAVSLDGPEAFAATLESTGTATVQRLA